MKYRQGCRNKVGVGLLVGRRTEQDCVVVKLMDICNRVGKSEEHPDYTLFSGRNVGRKGGVLVGCYQFIFSNLATLKKILAQAGGRF